MNRCTKIRPFAGGCILSAGHEFSVSDPWPRCMSAGGELFDGLEADTINMRLGEGTVTVRVTETLWVQETVFRDPQAPHRMKNTIIVLDRATGREWRHPGYGDRSLPLLTQARAAQCVQDYLAVRAEERACRIKCRECKRLTGHKLDCSQGR